MERDNAVLPLTSRGTGDWTWPPYAPVDAPGVVFETGRWASPTCVRRPWVRLGRWTLLYRRGA